MSRNTFELDERIKAQPEELRELLIPVFEQLDLDFAQHQSQKRLEKTVEQVATKQITSQRAAEITEQYRQIMFTGMIQAMQIGYLQALQDYEVSPADMLERIHMAIDAVEGDHLKPHQHSIISIEIEKLWTYKNED